MRRDAARRIALCFAFVFSACTDSERGRVDLERKKNSYAALSETHKKLADDCMKVSKFDEDYMLVRGLDNEIAGTTRIILNSIGDSGDSFIRCDYKLKSLKRIKAEFIYNGEIIRTF